MKILHEQQYICPKCKKKYTHSEWSEETPPVELQCDDCDKTPKKIHTAFSPSWKKYEDGMHSDNNAIAKQSTDKFMAEREHAMKTDKTAKQWEESRKQSWAKDKPYYVKKVEEAGI